MPPPAQILPHIPSTPHIKPGKAPWLVALLAVVLVFAAEQGIEYFARRSDLEQEKSSVKDALSTLRARLEVVVNANLLMVNGLTAVISAQPDIDQAGFARIARGLIDGRSALRNIAGAPNMVISLMYPLAGNEAAIGLDYLRHPTQAAAARRVMETGQPVVAGPLPLVQGGVGIVARQPVYLPAEQPGGKPRLWGLVSAVIDIDTLYRLAGLGEHAPGLRLAMRGSDGTGAKGPVFYGDARVFAATPVIETITLPGGTWQLAGMPAAGWGRTSQTLWMIRLFGLLAAVAAGTLSYFLARGRQTLAGSEARYRHLFEHNPAPMLVYEKGSLRLLAVNEAFSRHYGYSREESLALRLTDLYPEQERQPIAQLAASLSGLAYVGEWHHLKKDGGQIVIEARSHDLPYEGRAARIAVITDITARKQTEAALREQEAFFRLIAENMGDLVAVLDLDGRRLYNSPSYRALLGAPEALKGTDSFVEIHAEDRDGVRAAFMDTVRTGVGHRANFRFVLPNGDIRDMESQGGVIRGPDGKVARVVVVSRDVTERKCMEDEIQQLNAELEERVRARTAELATANRELETFTYSVSHDLKAPLRGIDGYSRLLLEDHQAQLDEEGRLFLANVRQGVDQMNQLIEDLLAYSRMERRDLHGVSLDLPRLVAGVLNERADEIAARGMRVELELDALQAHADADGLTLVLRNLIDNALKFTRDSRPPTLSISGTPSEKSIILAIRDNGIGFDMEFQDRIFEIFQRLQRAEDYPGTGVGLAIVRRAVQRMGGRIWTESAPGQGATFFLELPR